MGCGASKPGEGAAPTRLNVTTTSGAASATSHLTFKIVLIGDKATGKSATMMRFHRDAFTEFPTSTIGAAFASRDVKIADGTTVKFQIWDTAGTEEYLSMTKSFFRDAAAALVVYDVTNPASFAHVTKWLHEFRDVCPDSPAVLVGNKCDLEAEGLRRVTADDAIAMSEQEGFMGPFDVSAKAGYGVNDAFMAVAEALVASRRRGGA